MNTDSIQELKRTLATMVAIDSTSRLSNAPVIEFLETRVRAASFECERQVYRDDAGIEKINLVCRRGKTSSLALVGHTDCVPYDQAWTEALTLTERDGKLYGRGACDTKAFIACAIIAAERTDSPLTLIFTADEEVGCVGAKRLLTARPILVKHAIVGEPTQLTPVRANKGYCLADVRIIGKEGHSAYPETGASAILAGGRFLALLESRGNGELRALRDETFEPPYTTFNVGTIAGGKAKNVIAGECRMVVEWRPIPEQPVEAGRDLLWAIAREIESTVPGIRIEVDALRMDAGVSTSLEAPVVQFLARASGRAPTSVPFGTESPQLTAMGAQACVFGPGDIRVAHQTGEFVPVSELVSCAEILESAISHFANFQPVRSG